MFTDTTTAPKIYLQGYTYRQPVPFAIVYDGDPTGYSRDISEVNFEFRGLTRAAADSIATTYKNSTVSDSYVVDAYWARQNDAGMYLVHVTQKTLGPWIADS